MMMSELYLPVRHAHIGMVVLSGSLFAIRGVAGIAGAPWAMARAVRWLSYGIDTLLLAAALTLLAILQINPVTTPWLAAKLVSISIK